MSIHHDEGEALRARLDALPEAERGAAMLSIFEGRGEPTAPPKESPDGRAKVEWTVDMVRASEIEPKPVEWLWRPRVPLGMLTMFAGNPKLGKSFLTTAMAAAVGRGAALPFGDVPDGPGSVVLMSAEDDPARTIVPRLIAAGADRDRVHVLRSMRSEDGLEAMPSLKTDVDRIREAVETLGDVRLIVVDPISAYLGGTDDHKNGELRGVLSPLKATAERLNAAVVLVSHLNKSASASSAIYRIQGSIAYAGACRANFLFVRDPDDPTGRRVLMLDAGCNLAPSQKGLAYSIEDFGDGPTVAWEDAEVDVTADDALAAEVDKRPKADAGEARACDTWLRGTLQSGPLSAKDVFKHGAEAGFSQKQLRLAKERIGAVSKREGYGPGSSCAWMLDDPTATP